MRETRCCPTCGAEFSAEVADAPCPKCLLEAGLGPSTTVPSAEALTLPPTTARTDAELPIERQTDDGPGIGHYRNLEAVHDWSGGTVYQAYHPGLDRTVLLRALDSSADETTRNAFLARAKTLSQLNHPHTAATLEAGEDEGVAYVAEELVDGKPIRGFLPRSRRERWQEGFFPGRKVMGAMRAAAMGLQAIHDEGLVHGRLNPDSIRIDENGIVRLVGLGEASDATDDRFASPQGEKSVADDIYRLGATFCFLVTGKLPVELDPTLSAKTVARQLKKCNPGLRQDYCQVVAECVAQPAGTLPSADEVARRLEHPLNVQVTRAGWRPRFYSLLLEQFCLMVFLGLLQRAVIKQFAVQLEGTSALNLLILVTPALYAIVLESLFGWTLARRFFGLRLLDEAGERSSWWRRFSRALLKYVLLTLMFVAPAVAAPLLNGMGSGVMLAVLLTLIGMLSPLLFLYLPARWIPCRWTYYDLLAGVTWAEEASVATATTEHHQSDLSAASSGDAADRIDHYDIYETLGAGGMGCVYRAHDRVLGRQVAIKVLAEHLRDPLLLERFHREARLAAKVSHPNVAKVFGNGTCDGTPYIAMEFVKGRNLQEVLKEEGRLTITTAWNHIIQAAEALAAADRSGVVHRDIKPANLMIGEDGQLKVTDFGVSRQTRVDASVTQTGTIVGTPAYMAPEQAMGKDVDCRCDIYALGMTLYHLLAGRAPFRGENSVQILAQQMADMPPSLLGEVDGLSTEQHDVIMKMIAKKPEERFGNYRELLTTLHRHAPGVDRLAKPAKRLAAEVCDWVGFYFVFSMMMAVVFMGGQQLGLTRESGTTAVGVLMFIFLTTITMVNVFMTGRSGATPGKRLLSLRVARSHAYRVGYVRAAIRFAAAFPLFVVGLPMMLFDQFLTQGPRTGLYWDVRYYLSITVVVLQVLGGVASACLLWLHPSRRTLHDLIAGTIVVKEETTT